MITLFLLTGWFLRHCESALQHVNEGLLQRLDPQQAEVIVHQGEAAAGEAMGSFVGSPSQPRGGGL